MLYEPNSEGLIESNNAIYCIRNIITGKSYIGSTSMLSVRKKMHIVGLHSNRHHCKHLQNSYNKQERLGFVFGVIEYCNKDETITREQYWIDLLKSNDPNHGYNTRLVCWSNKGFKQSQEVKDGMAKRMRERVVSQSTREKQRAHSIGRLLSEATKAKLRKENLSDEKRLKMSLAKKGKPSDNRLFTESQIIDIKTSHLSSRLLGVKYNVSKTTILNIIKGQIYNNINQPAVKKIRVWRSGFKHSEETRAKISIATTGVPKTKKIYAC